jgi:hypothetical protein
MGAELTAAIALGAATAVLVTVGALIVALVIEAAREGDDVVGDVQRFVELSAAAHASLPHGSLLSDPDGETSAAIAQLLATKERARRALWGSGNANGKEQR